MKIFSKFFSAAPEITSKGQNGQHDRVNPKNDQIEQLLHLWENQEADRKNPSPTIDWDALFEQSDVGKALEELF